MAGQQTATGLISNMINFILATGIFTLPFSFFETGIILGTLTLIVTSLMAYVTSQLLIEALAIQNAFYKEEKEVLQCATVKTSATPADNLNTNANESASIEVKEQLINNNALEMDEQQDNFYISKRYELSKLANKGFTKPFYALTTIVMIFYLYIGLTTKAILVGTSVRDIVGLMIYGPGSTESLPKSFYIMVICIFNLFVIIIAQRNISSLKGFSTFMMFSRFFMILLILGSCFYSMFVYGVASFSDIPKFQIKNIAMMMGNALFFFMIHHSVPGMVEGMTPQRKLSKIMFVGYIFSLSVMVFFGFVSVFAFGHIHDCNKNKFPTAIQSAFSSNFLDFGVVGYIINFYPIMNVITSAMTLITLKNNIIQIIAMCSADFANKCQTNFDSDVFSAEFVIQFLKGFLVCLIVMIPCFVISIAFTDLQDVMKYFSSVSGFLLIIVIPVCLVIKFRNKFRESGVQPGKLNRSIFNKLWQFVVIFVVSAGIASLIVYGMFNGTSKSCVYEDENTRVLFNVLLTSGLQ